MPPSRPNLLNLAFIYLNTLEVCLATAGWLGDFGTPPPPRLAGWLARPRKTTKIRSAPLYRLFSHMVWVWVWVCKGGGRSTTFQEHPYLLLQVALPLEPPVKTKNTKHRIAESNECSTTNVLVTDVKGLPPIPQSTQLSTIRNIYHPCCIIYPKAPFQRTLISPTLHSATRQVRVDRVPSWDPKAAGARPFYIPGPVDTCEFVGHANKIPHFVLLKKCMHWGLSMHACRRGLDIGTLQHHATAILLVVVQLDH